MLYTSKSPHLGGIKRVHSKDSTKQQFGSLPPAQPAMTRYCLCLASLCTAPASDSAATGKERLVSFRKSTIGNMVFPSRTKETAWASFVFLLPLSAPVHARVYKDSITWKAGTQSGAPRKTRYEGGKWRNMEEPRVKGCIGCKKAWRARFRRLAPEPSHGSLLKLLSWVCRTL
jgi:hypothetical protein